MATKFGVTLVSFIGALVVAGFGFALGMYIGTSQGAAAPSAVPAVAEAPATPEPTPTPEPPTPTPEPTTTNTESQASSAPTPDPLALGRELFEETCAPCHGSDATGIPGIGLNLRESDFVGALSVDELAHFLAIGRPADDPLNTTGIDMPPRGGREDLTDEELQLIAQYLHSINQRVGQPSEKAEQFRQRLTETLEEQAITLGRTTYLRYCAVCHGPDGKGRPGLGKDLVDSTFIAQLSDEELALFIARGRPVGDPLNTTGIAMLPYGGQQPFDDETMQNLVAYLRSVNRGDELLAAGLPTPTPLPPPTPVPTPTPAGEEDLATQAWAILNRASPPCVTCHQIGDRGSKMGPGPDLTQLGAVAATRVEGMSAEEYVKQSIVDPGAFVAPECPTGRCINVMPKNYGDQFSEEELDILARYLLSLSSEGE